MKPLTASPDCPILLVVADFRTQNRQMRYRLSKLCLRRADTLEPLANAAGQGRRVCLPYLLQAARCTCQCKTTLLAPGPCVAGPSNQDKQVQQARGAQRLFICSLGMQVST